MTDQKPRETKPKCRCYINMKYYSRVVSGKINGTLKGYKPCPIHDKAEDKLDRSLDMNGYYDCV